MCQPFASAGSGFTANIRNRPMSTLCLPDFVPMQIDCLRQYTGPLPGVAEVTQRIQARGIKIGSTTGFTRAMVDILEEEAAKQGYRPDASVAGDPARR